MNSAYIYAWVDEEEVIPATRPTGTMVYRLLPNIEYPVTHEFKSKLFNVLAYTAALLSLVILAVANGTSRKLPPNTC